MSRNELKVQSGQVVVLRLFDVAYEINLRRAEELWAQRAQGPSARSRLVGTPAKAVSFGVPPLALEFGPLTLEVDGTSVQAMAGLRLYNFGIVAFALRLPVQDLPWSDFTRLVNATHDAVGPEANSPVWERLLSQMQELIGGALDRPTIAPLQEDYLIALAESFDEAVTAEALQERVDLVPLLSGEQRPLSEGARRDLLRHRFSYHPDDFVVITWDRAFIYEPRHETDVADVLEIANAQLLEMRTYDEMLDAEMPRMHDLVEAARGRADLLAARRYARLARRLYALVAEVTELAERVDNALQVTEDVYLARVYAAAIELFRVPNVSTAVDRKLAIIRETYTALHSEAAGSRAELLETAILVLIAVEIVLSLARP
ncbi:conserved protein of unknown function [Rhodovastum atsumiense]|uniref:RMD1 family protein n=1 Tax=Rhodovastum atsumiense TaxID=504468 RepID=A0A5M6J0Y5_9PROT|nr:hypothetical protein [Rhodovastum atsumiense]KAA5613288.1 hypothetical protein F1189_06250 [Rhodovastum atsumiense]CAH2600547.1 conserved protein of unknown function [Rhodovastum atsumiense]